MLHVACVCVCVCAYACVHEHAVCRLRVWLFFKYLFYYVYSILSVCMPEGQKRAPDPITDGCEPPSGCWELNSGSLEEQAMLLTSEPSLQPVCVFS